MLIQHQICNLLYRWSKRSTWKSKRKSTGFLPDLLNFEIKFVSSNKDFLPSRNAPSSLKQSLQVCFFSWWAVKAFIPRIYWKSSVRGTSGHVVDFRSKKMAFSTPYRVALGLPSPSPRVCTDGRTGVRTLTSQPKFWHQQVTKIFVSTGYPIWLPMVLRPCGLPPQRSSGTMCNFSKNTSKFSHMFLLKIYKW